jgi:hypothetical protein
VSVVTSARQAVGPAGEPRGPRTLQGDYTIQPVGRASSR